MALEGGSPLSIREDGCLVPIISSFGSGIRPLQRVAYGSVCVGLAHPGRIYIFVL